MIWRNHWDARSAEALARITLQDNDAKITHTPPNEGDEFMQETAIEDDEDDAEPVPASRRHPV